MPHDSKFRGHDNHLEKGDFINHSVNTHKNVPELQRIIMSERRQRNKSTYCIIPFIYHFRKCTLIDSDRKQISGFLWAKKEGWIVKGHKEDSGGDRYVHLLDCGDF